MKMSLLQYVQSILSSLSSDEVNSISDTPESLQVAEIVKTTYFNVVARTDLPEHKQLIQLNSSLDPDSPVIMYLPEGVTKIEWLKYFNASTSVDDDGRLHDINVDITNNSGTSELIPAGYQYVTIVPVQQFLDLTSSFNPTDTNVGSFEYSDNSIIPGGSYTFYFKTNKQPQYCCLLSDNVVVFDGFDANIDSTLQSQKTQAYGFVSPVWRMEDSFIPSLDDRQVPLLLNEAKSLAFFELKQQVHQKAEQEAKRQWSAVQRDKSRVNRPSYFDQLPNFGRAGQYFGSSYFKMKGWDRP